MIAGISLLIFIILVALLSFFWIFVLIDILRSDFTDPSSKLIWFLFVLFSHFLGSIIYLIFGKSSKIGY